MTRSMRLTLGIATIILLLSAISAHAQESLDTAYKKEFAYLEAERRALKARIADLDKQAGENLLAAKKQLEQTQADLLQLTATADSHAERLSNMEEASLATSERSEALDALLSQVQTSLKAHGAPLSDLADETPEAKSQALEAAFTRAVSRLTELGRVRAQDGSFFSTNGDRLQGRIVRVGNVAAYGISGNVAGALAPAGEGRLRVWPEDAAESAQAILSQVAIPRIDIFLYDSPEKAIEPREGKSVLEVIQSGGVIAWIIVILGIAALIMIALRTFFLSRSASRSDDLLARIIPMIEQGWRDEALAECKPTRGATARVLAATIRNLRSGRDQLDNVISEAILHETPYLDRFGAILLVLAAVSPLLGLLGTVTGMISTFDVITEFGTGDPKLLSGGISEALITTELGLIVAIPTLLAGNLLSSWANSIKSGMEHAALVISNVYDSKGRDREQMATSAAATRAQVEAF